MPENALEALDIRRIARGLGQIVTELDSAVSIGFDHFNDQRQRCRAEVVGKIRAPAKAHPNAASKVVGELDNGAKVKPIAEDDQFVTRVNAVPLVKGNR